MFFSSMADKIPTKMSFFPKVFMLFECTYTSVVIDKKSKRSYNQGFSYFFACWWRIRIRTKLLSQMQRCGSRFNLPVRIRSFWSRPSIFCIVNRCVLLGTRGCRKIKDFLTSQVTGTGTYSLDHILYSWHLHYYVEKVCCSLGWSGSEMLVPDPTKPKMSGSYRFGFRALTRWIQVDPAKPTKSFCGNGFLYFYLWASDIMIPAAVLTFTFTYLYVLKKGVPSCDTFTILMNMGALLAACTSWSGREAGPVGVAVPRDLSTSVQVIA
jgi:hypothetical protein